MPTNRSIIAVFMTCFLFISPIGAKPIAAEKEKSHLNRNQQHKRYQQKLNAKKSKSQKKVPIKKPGKIIVPDQSKNEIFNDRKRKSRSSVKEGRSDPKYKKKTPKKSWHKKYKEPIKSRNKNKKTTWRKRIHRTLEGFFGP